MRRFTKFSLVFGLSFIFSLWAHGADTTEEVEDPHTQSNYQDVSVKHLSMHLTLDMDRHTFYGFVDLRIDNLTQKDRLILDTSDLIVRKVVLDPDEYRARETGFSVENSTDAVRGKLLSIGINPLVKIVRVFYETTPKAAGLDWLNPKVTGDGFPMVVTQFEPINARSFVPCQDTPAQKITYDATITLKSSETDSRMRVLMAAPIRVNMGERVFFFKMDIPTHTYHIALAAVVI
jgi:aminopeptidase N